MGKPEIISGRASGIFLLWQKAWRSGLAVVVIAASVFFFNAWLHGPQPRGISAYSLAVDVAFKEGNVPSHIFLANVRDDGSPLASGVAPAREADQQEACQKCRRHGDSVHRPVSPYYH